MTEQLPLAVAVESRRRIGGGGTAAHPSERPRTVPRAAGDVAPQ